MTANNTANPAPACQPANAHQTPLRRLLTREEAADLLRVSERTLFTITRRDAIPVVHIGGRVLYNPSDLEKWIAANTI